MSNLGLFGSTVPSVPTGIAKWRLAFFFSIWFIRLNIFILHYQGNDRSNPGGKRRDPGRREDRLGSSIMPMDHLRL